MKQIKIRFFIKPVVTVNEDGTIDAVTVISDEDHRDLWAMIEGSPLDGSYELAEPFMGIHFLPVAND